jgi:protein involved in polysaccharide export with SLBB domain
MMSLLLIAMAQATHAQQSASAPRGLSQNSCQQIAVFGAVRTPSRLDARQRLRLLEVLGRVGGPNERAGKTVRIVHTCNCSPCDKLEPKASVVDEYNLIDVLRGRENGNPYVVPGDIVVVPEADSVLVMGNVIKPEALAFVERMTATRAVALAGGVRKSGEVVAIRIYRSSAGAPRPTPIIVNLRAIIEHRTEDPLLQPWDIVEVSDDQGHFQPLKPLGPPTRDPPLGPRKDTSCS